LAAVVLAGGAARRGGGATKPALQVGGRALLSRVLDAAGHARPRIVVGPPDLAALLPPDVTLTREDPPGGGPVAALAAGLSNLSGPDPDSQVAVLAGDLPFLSTEAVDALRAAHSREHVAVAVDRAVTVDGAVLVDDADRPQWLAGVWRLGSLLDGLAVLGDPFGRAMRELVGGLRVIPIRLTGLGPPPWFDCDTAEDLRRAEELARGDFRRRSTRYFG
jgi:molybdopterin-guanine dinucleotide biosynthesis protein A